MIVRKIELKNFRQYIDTTIEFSTDKEKNITLVMGDNGTGKTTLAQAFQWALYGDTNFQVKELINRKVREQMPLDGHGSTKPVSVTLEVEYNEQIYTIKRLVTYKRKSHTKVELFGETKFTISYFDEDGSQVYMPDHKKPYFMKKLLPQDLSKFFFFDGEKIEEMSKNIQKGKGEDFKEAVYSLVGLGATQNAIEHMKSKSYAKKSVIKVLTDEVEENSKSAKQLAKYNSEIEAKNKELEEKNEKKAVLETEIQALEESNKKCNEIIIKETPKMQLKEEYGKLTNELENLRKKKNDYIENDLLKDFKQGFYGFCMTPVMQLPQISEMLEASAPTKKTIPGLTKKTIDHLLKKGVCLCGTCLQENSLAYKTVEELLEYAYPKTIGMLKEDYLKEQKMIETEGKNFFSIIQRRMKGLSDLNAQIEGKESELAEKMDQLANTDKGEEAKKQLAANEKLLKSKKSILISVEADLKNLDKEIRRIESEKEKLIIVDENTIRAQRYLAYATAVFEIMKSGYEKKENRCRIRLEENMNNIFESIYDGNIKISIDEKYRIFANVHEQFSAGDEVERNTAQSYALIFAFIAAVIDLAKQKINDDAIVPEELIDLEKEGYPLVMDAPLSAFDKRRIKSICTEIPRIADQVIMFIKDTDGDIAEKNMNQKIGKRYSIKKVNGSNLESQVLEDM